MEICPIITRSGKLIDEVYNRVFCKSINEIKEKHKTGKLKSKPPFPKELLKKIIEGVKKSRLIDNKTKELL